MRYEVSKGVLRVNLRDIREQPESMHWTMECADHALAALWIGEASSEAGRTTSKSPQGCRWQSYNPLYSGLEDIVIMLSSIQASKCHRSLAEMTDLAFPFGHATAKSFYISTRCEIFFLNEYHYVYQHANRRDVIACKQQDIGAIVRDDFECLPIGGRHPWQREGQNDGSSSQGSERYWSLVSLISLRLCGLGLKLLPIPHQFPRPPSRFQVATHLTLRSCPTLRFVLFLLSK
jgi:hypothetical protein